MQTDVAETIFDRVKVLPEPKQRKVLDYVNDLMDENGATFFDLVRSVEERGKQIPDEVWDELPTDSSINLDHYLYGAKKK